jgi:hypothetical protein
MEKKKESGRKERSKMGEKEKKNKNKNEREKKSVRPIDRRRGGCV